MCLIIARPKRRHGQADITPAMIDNSIVCGNDDSFGLMWAEGGALLHWHGLQADLAEFDYLVANLNKTPFSFALHMRFATHGLITLNNCHPFFPRQGLGMMHNGILSNYTPAKGTDHSDTAVLSESLRMFPKRFWRNEQLMYALGHTIGGSNKLCFLDAEGQFYLVNEDRGIWEHGAWFSNDSHLPQSNRRWSIKSAYDWDDADYETAKPGSIIKAPAADNPTPIIGVYKYDGGALCSACSLSVPNGMIATYIEQGDGGMYCDMCGVDMGDLYVSSTGWE